jgi:hypothetical protein
MRSYGAISDIVVASAVSTSRGRIVSTDGLVLSDPLLTINMPKLSFWFQQLSPVVAGHGVSITLQFSVRPQTIGKSGNASTDEWLTLNTSPIVLDPGGTPTRIMIEFPASKIRFRGIGLMNEAFSVDYVLACSM